MCQKNAVAMEIKKVYLQSDPRVKTAIIIVDRFCGVRVRKEGREMTQLFNRNQDLLIL